MKEKVEEIIDGFTIKYHANGKPIWSKGKIANGKPVGNWEWYRIEGTIKRSGHFNNGIQSANGLLITATENLTRRLTNDKN